MVSANSEVIIADVRVFLNIGNSPPCIFRSRGDDVFSGEMLFDNIGGNHCATQPASCVCNTYEPISGNCFRCPTLFKPQKLPNRAEGEVE